MPTMRTANAPVPRNSCEKMGFLRRTATPLVEPGSAVFESPDEDRSTDTYDTLTRGSRKVNSMSTMKLIVTNTTVMNTTMACSNG